MKWGVARRPEGDFPLAGALPDQRPICPICKARYVYMLGPDPHTYVDPGHCPDCCRVVYLADRLIEAIPGLLDAKGRQE